MEEDFISALVPPSRIKRRPSDLLGERRTALSRVTGAATPTVKELTRHAERYGSEAVVETAAELGYSFEACVRLQDACDRFDAARLRKERPHARAPRLASTEDRVSALMGLKEEKEES